MDGHHVAGLPPQRELAEPIKEVVAGLDTDSVRDFAQSGIGGFCRDVPDPKALHCFLPPNSQPPARCDTGHVHEVEQHTVMISKQAVHICRALLLLKVHQPTQHSMAFRTAINVVAQEHDVGAAIAPVIFDGCKHPVEKIQATVNVTDGV
nr:hypothetical protein [Aliiruegeria haliotis]